MVKRFSSSGLTSKKYIKALILQPQFYQSPDKIINNINGTIKSLEDLGLNEAAFISAACKSPQLFFQKPKTLEKNIREVIKRFKKEKLDGKKYLKAALNQPALFILSPSTTESKIRDGAKAFETQGLTTTDYLNLALSQPSLFYQNPKTIKEHIEIMQTIRKDKLSSEGSQSNSGIELIHDSLSYNLGYSKEHLFLILLNRKLSKCFDLPIKQENKLKESIIEKLKTQNPKAIHLSLPNNAHSREFVEFAEKISIGTLNRNVFKIKLVDEEKPYPEDYLNLIKKHN